MIRKILISLPLIFFTAITAADQLSLDDIVCGSDLPEGVEMRVTYGPFWDGAWQLSVLRAEDGPLPQLRVDVLEVLPAEYTVNIIYSAERPANDSDLRRLRQASSVMIAEMVNLGDERPELRSEQRPLMIQVSGSEGVSCASGYANWPRIPGTYYFEAIDTLRDAVLQPNVTRDPWPAVRLHLRQIRSPWQR